eukprot:4685016-Amphidinium_carterae.3
MPLTPTTATAAATASNKEETPGQAPMLRHQMSGWKPSPEEGEQDIEGAQLRPEKRARGCSACAGLSYQHSKGCMRFQQYVNSDPEFAA